MGYTRYTHTHHPIMAKTFEKTTVIEATGATWYTICLAYAWFVRDVCTVRAWCVHGACMGCVHGTYNVIEATGVTSARGASAKTTASMAMLLKMTMPTPSQKSRRLNRGS